MQTLYLILAHFIADFVLQPDRILQMKHESWRGNAIHSIIHGLAALIVLLPFLPATGVFSVVLIIAVSHFFIDSAKINFEKKADKYVKPFLVDQAAHLLLIAAAGFLLAEEQIQPWFGAVEQLARWYSNPFVPAGLILLILVTYGYDLFLYQFVRADNKKRAYKPNHGRMLKNLLIWAIIYVLFLIFGVYSIAAFALF